MRRQGTALRRLACVLAAALAGTSGCVSCLCPVAPVSDDTAARAAALPPACRNHVYIFLINGEAPFDLANLSGVRDALIGLGYVKTYRGEWYHSGYFKDEICRLRRDDESARFVVMGFGLGAYAARDLADAVRPQGATLDLLAYCGGLDLAQGKCEEGRPSNVGRFLQLIPGETDTTATTVEGAEVVYYAAGGPFASPGQGYPMEVLAGDLEEVASHVRVVDLRPVADASLDRGPSPRAAATRDALPRDDWDFLKPAQPYPRALPKPEVLQAMPKAP